MQPFTIALDKFSALCYTVRVLQSNGAVRLGFAALIFIVKKGVYFFMEKVPELFGSMVFNDSVMRERLPKDTYKAAVDGRKRGDHFVIRNL